MSEIKVTDRRMFTPDGRLREEFAAEFANAPGAAATRVAGPEPSPIEPPAAASAAPDSAETAPRSAGAAMPAEPPSGLFGAEPAAGVAAWPASAPANPPQGLLELVEFLAGWTLANLGEMPLPDGRLARDLDAARFYIDLIAALKDQWGPRLGPQEKRFLEGYLDQLRLRYVAHRG